MLNKQGVGRGRLAQTGERPLTIPGIPGRIYVEEGFFRMKGHKTSSICAFKQKLDKRGLYANLIEWKGQRSPE